MFNFLVKTGRGLQYGRFSSKRTVLKYKRAKVNHLYRPPVGTFSQVSSFPPRSDTSQFCLPSNRKTGPAGWSHTLVPFTLLTPHRDYRKNVFWENDCHWVCTPSDSSIPFKSTPRLSIEGPPNMLCLPTQKTSIEIIKLKKTLVQ